MGLKSLPILCSSSLSLPEFLISTSIFFKSLYLSSLEDWGPLEKHDTENVL